MFYFALWNGRALMNLFRNAALFYWLFVVGGNIFRVRALNLTVPFGSGQTISGTGRVRASILSPCRPLDVRSVNRFHRRCHSKTQLPIWHILMWVLWYMVQSFVNKINNCLAGKCYIATMLFDSCRAHTFKSSHICGLRLRLKNTNLCSCFPELSRIL